MVAAEPGFITGKRVIADALLIALAANLGNLLDRAPGRTIKVALVAYVPVALLLGTGAVGIAVAPVMGAALGVLPEDLRERLMLGDTGANVLGAVLGVAIVLGTGRGTRNGVIIGVDRAQPGGGVRVVQSGDRPGPAAALVRPAGGGPRRRRWPVRTAPTP